MWFPPVGDAVLSGTTRVRPSAGTLSRVLDGEAVLLGAATARYYGLDPVGTRIWSLLGEGEDLDGVTRAVVREYEVAEPQARADVYALVADLLQHGLIEVIPHR